MLTLIKDLQMRLKQKESEMKKLQLKYEVSVSLIAKERTKNQYLQSLIDSSKETNSEILDEIETEMQEDDIIVSNHIAKFKPNAKSQMPNVEKYTFIEEICLDVDDDDGDDGNLEITVLDMNGVHERHDNDEFLIEDCETDIGSEQVELIPESGEKNSKIIDEDLNSEHCILDEETTQTLSEVEIEESRETQIIQLDDIRLINEQKLFTEKNRSVKKRRGCRRCEGCKYECLSCKFCLDKPKNGGKGKLRQVCEKKHCRNVI